MREIVPFLVFGLGFSFALLKLRKTWKFRLYRRTERWFKLCVYSFLVLIFSWGLFVQLDRVGVKVVCARGWVHGSRKSFGGVDLLGRPAPGLSWVMIKVPDGEFAASRPKFEVFDIRYRVGRFTGRIYAGEPRHPSENYCEKED